MNRFLIAAVAIVLAAIGVTRTTGASELRQRVDARSLADAIKPGQWEFTAQMQLPGMPNLSSGAKLSPDMQMQQGGMQSTYKTCVDSNKAVPSDPRGQCTIENVQRHGATITWTGLCATKQGAVRSEGIAHYSGDTMEANLTTEVPGANGHTIETAQRITGHYLGACAK